MYPKAPLKGLFGPEMAFPAPDQMYSSTGTEEYELIHTELSQGDE